MRAKCRAPLITPTVSSGRPNRASSAATTKSAGSGDRNPSTERGAVDCAYDGHTAIRNGEEGLAHLPHSLPSVLRSHRRELVKVVAGTEMRTFPTENHDANIGPAWSTSANNAAISWYIA